MTRRDKGGYPQRSLTEEQRSQPAFSSKTLRAAGLLSVACVGSAVTARCGDVPASPPWPQPKSLAAGPRAIFRQALKTKRPRKRAAEQPDESNGFVHHGDTEITEM